MIVKTAGCANRVWVWRGGRVVALIAILICLATTAAADRENVPCRNTTNARALDFWVGVWRVEGVDGSFYGDNRVETALSGCAVFEHWRNREGSEGKSLFYFDAATDLWQQVWVTGDTSRQGGLKQKQMIAATTDGAVRFQGEVARPEGGFYLDRTTLTPLEGGRVRQVIEVSTTDGKEWITTFDAIYIPVSETDGGSDEG